LLIRLDYWEYACNVYLLDPAMNDGDAFDGSAEEEKELVERVCAFMTTRAGEITTP